MVNDNNKAWPKTDGLIYQLTLNGKTYTICMQDDFARACSRKMQPLGQERVRSGMMINHSTLDYHVTNFNTLSRWLLRVHTDKSKL